MKMNGHSLICACGISLLQACGVAIESSSTEIHSDYVTYEIFEYDNVDRVKTFLTSDCIDLDRDEDSGRVLIENRYSDELEFAWTLRDERIEFRIEDNDDVISRVKYESDFFRNGSSVENKINPTFGGTYLVNLSGPGCDR